MISEILTIIITLWKFIVYCTPHWYPVYDDEIGIWTRFGSCRGKFWHKGHNARRIKSGSWQPIWMVIEKPYKIQANEQWKDFRGQSITTKDHKTVAISGSVCYTVEDAEKAIFKVYEIDTSLPTMSLGIICHYACQHTLDEMLDADAIASEIQKGIRGEAVRSWGIRVHTVRITDIAEHRVIRVLGGDVTTKYVPIQAEGTIV